MNKSKWGYFLLAFIGFVVICVIIYLAPIEQNSEYHNFSDNIKLFGIPNFLNVISNFPFLLVGFLGIKKYVKNPLSQRQYLMFFAGVLLVAFGSGYYHWNPTNDTLLWDRLPMTILFMALFSIIISEFISEKLGQKLLIPLVLIGVLSIFWWQYFDDLSMYVIVQFYPMIAIPIILLIFKSENGNNRAYWYLLLAYVVAKLFEHFDNEVFTILGFVSGHTLKHIAASIGLYIVYKSFSENEKIEYSKS